MFALKLNGETISTESQAGSLRNLEHQAFGIVKYKAAIGCKVEIDFPGNPVHTQWHIGPDVLSLEKQGVPE